MNGIFSTERTSGEYLVLNSCGIQKFYDTDGNCLRENGRVDYHILYVASGFCYVYGKEEVVAPKGSIIIFRPGERQQYSFYAKDKSVSYFLHFTGVGCGHILDNLGLGKERIYYIGKNIYFEEIFEKMLRENALKQNSYEMYCGGLLMELLAVISRYARISDSNIAGRSEKIVDNALQEIYTNLTTISVSQLASSCYLSSGRFSHIFKEVTGTPPQEYINGMKIQKAKDMLAYTDLTISAIARDVGFDDQNYFSRLFKKYTTFSPSEYRKNCK